MPKIKPFLISLFIPPAVGGASALVSGIPMELYEGIKRPPLSPPPWVFPVVWTVLYLLMGAACYRVYVSRDTETRPALFFYCVQLILNFLWSPIFFAKQNYALALFVLVLLIIAAVITAVRFYRIDRAAGLLLVPYILWLLFACGLNAGIWLLNRRSVTLT